MKENSCMNTAFKDIREAWDRWAKALIKCPRIVEKSR